MFESLKKLLGFGPKVDFLKLIKTGAIVVDVRTKEEYKTGNIKKSINIPLHVLQNNLSKIKKDKTIITCCASGMRSNSAKNILLSNGYTNVYNGGGWTRLNSKIN
ncbi:rhodanese-like domain-containing protein [Bacteroidota bacterium]